MGLRGLALFVLAPLSLTAAEHQRFARHELPRPPATLRGAALDGSRLVAWGDALVEWSARGRSFRTLARADFQEGGCVADLDGDGRKDFIAQEGAGLGNLVWRRGPKWQPERIDSRIEMHDCLGATLFGRRGILMVQRYGQVRFYERPAGSIERWPYREIYSFYTASKQGGLLLADVDRDGFTDILCGNYWIRSPKSFDLPWRLFAINTDHETADAATARTAIFENTAELLTVAVSQGHKADAKLSLFSRPRNPTELWTEQRLNPVRTLAYPHGLDSADFDGDGDADLAVAENSGEASRIQVVWNLGGGNFRVEGIGAGQPTHTLLAVDLNRDGRIDLLAVGPQIAAWWENRYPLRK